MCTPVFQNRMASTPPQQQPDGREGGGVGTAAAAGHNDSPTQRPASATTKLGDKLEVDSEQTGIETEMAALTSSPCHNHQFPESPHPSSSTETATSTTCGSPVNGADSSRDQGVTIVENTHNATSSIGMTSTDSASATISAAIATSATASDAQQSQKLADNPTRELSYAIDTIPEDDEHLRLSMKRLVSVNLMSHNMFMNLPKVAYNLGVATKAPFVHVQTTSRLASFERETIDHSGVKPSFSVSDFVTARRQLSYSRTSRTSSSKTSDADDELELGGDSFRRSPVTPVRVVGGVSGSQSQNSSTSSQSSQSQSSKRAPPVYPKPKGSRRAALLSTSAVLTGQGLALETLEEGHDVALMKIDVLQVMQRGGYFIKYGRLGAPHTVRFELTPDNQAIQWHSNKRSKSVEECQVKWDWVTEVRFGQETKTFARYPQHHLRSLSFSLIYTRPGGSERTLDIICEDPNEFVVWSQGSRYLHAMSKMPEGLGPNTTLILSLPIVSGYPSSDWLLDHETGLDVEDTIEEERNFELLLQNEGDASDMLNTQRQDPAARLAEAVEQLQRGLRSDGAHEDSVSYTRSVTESSLIVVPSGSGGEVPYLPPTLQAPVRFVTAVGRVLGSPGAIQSSVVDLSWIQQLIAFVPRRWHSKPWRRVFSLLDDGADFHTMRNRLIQSSAISFKRIMAGGTAADGSNPAETFGRGVVSRRGKAVKVNFGSGRDSHSDTRSTSSGDDRSPEDVENCPALLVLVDTSGTLFGGFAPRTWTSHPGITGSDSAFVFTCSAESDRVLHVYPAVPATVADADRAKAYQSTSDTGFGFGPLTSRQMAPLGEETKSLSLATTYGAALHLDFHLLHGSTRHCQEFGSPPLTPTTSFRVLGLELWAPVHR